MIEDLQNLPCQFLLLHTTQAVLTVLKPAGQTMWLSLSSLRPTTPTHPVKTGFARAWGALLHHLFGDPFYICPRGGASNANYLAQSYELTVAVDAVPVKFPFLVVDVKHYPDFSASRRKEADRQMRHRLRELLAAPEIGDMVGLSVCGAFFCLYRASYRDEDKIVTPSYRPMSSKTTDSNYLMGQWRVNVLSPEGVQTLKGLAESIKQEAANFRLVQPQRDLLELYKKPILKPEESHRRTFRLEDVPELQHGSQSEVHGDEEQEETQIRKKVTGREEQL